MSERAMKRQAERRAFTAAKRAAKAQGCACDVEFTVRRWVGEMPEMELRHDDWCPLLRVMEERGPDRVPQVIMDLRSGPGWTR